MGYDRKPLPVGVDDFEKLVARLAMRSEAVVRAAIG